MCNGLKNEKYLKYVDPPLFWYVIPSSLATSFTFSPTLYLKRLISAIGISSTQGN